MTAWPLVKNGLVALLPTLPGWSEVSVYNGPVVTGDAPTTFVTVGYVVGEDFGGTYEQDRGPGDMPMESGTVRSELVHGEGATDLPAVEAEAFQLMDAWQAAVDADPTLGVLRPGSTSTLSVDVQPTQGRAGAAQRLTVTLSYVARV